MVFFRFLHLNFNETLTNDVVSFEQLGRDMDRFEDGYEINLFLLHKTNLCLFFIKICLSQDMTKQSGMCMQGRLRSAGHSPSLIRVYAASIEVVYILVQLGRCPC